MSAIALVLAVADNGVIGNAGRLPWHLPDDLKHFKTVTLGKPVLMGRSTYESIGRPLPGRRNLVLTRDACASWPGVEAVSSLEEARARVSDAVELCVIGGAQIYAQALPMATCIYLTRVHGSPAGDTVFSLAAFEGWTETQREEHAADARHAYAMTFVRLQREDRR